MFLDLARKRRSVRQYTEDHVEREKIELCLEAARLSPSACNAQPWKFLVVDDPALVKRVAQATFDSVVRFNRFVLQAPVIILFISEPANLESKIGSGVRRIPLPLIDLGIAAAHFTLQAAELGLGTCILGWLREGKIRKIVDIPSGKRIPLAITLGYPKKEADIPKIRKEFSEIVLYNSYQNTTSKKAL